MLDRLFKREPAPAPTLEKGCVYRRLRADRTVETAKVIGVHRDSFGIPHVRYQVIFDRVDGLPHRDGPRTLSVASFIEQYRLQ